MSVNGRLARRVDARVGLKSRASELGPRAGGWSSVLGENGLTLLHKTAVDDINHEGSA
jgi:hypothetical protein